MEIIIDGVIGRNVNSGRIRKDIERVGNGPATVRFSSKGGDLMEGLTIFNILEEHANQFGLNGVIDGPCFSMGAVLSTACNRLSMKENTLLMFHNVQMKGAGVDVTNIDQFRDALQRNQDSLVKTLSRRMSRTEDQVRNFLAQERFLTAQEALQLGLIDEIIPVQRGRMSLVNLFEGNTAPDHIVEYVNQFNTRSESMALRELVSKMKIEVTNLSDDTEDSVIEDAVMVEFTNMSQRIATLEKDLEAEKKKKAPTKDPNKPEPVITAGMVSMAQNYRNTAIDALVGTKLTAAAAVEFKNQYASEEAAREALLSETGDTEFTNMIEILKKNDDVMTTGEKSGAQLGAVPHGGQGAVPVEKKEGWLAENMENLLSLEGNSSNN